MKHIFLFLLALAPALALAQTGTVKDSVRVLTTAEISAGAANDTANFYFIQGGSWKKIRMDSVFNYLRFRGMVDTFRNQTIFGAKTFNTAPTFNTALGIGSGGTGSTTQNFVDLTTTQSSIGGAKTFSSTVTGARFDPTSSSATGTGMFLPGTNRLGFSTSGISRMQISPGGKVIIGADTALTRFRIVGGNGDQFQLDNTGEQYTQFTFSNNNSLSKGGMYFDNSANEFGIFANTGVRMDFYTDGAGSAQRRMRITTGGDVGIGTGTGTVAAQLHTTGTVRFATFAGGGTTTASLDNDGDLIRTSDSRLKKQDFQYNIEGISAIKKLQPVAYKWLDAIKSRGDQAMTEVGFFADDVAQIIPSAAPLGNDGYYGFYDRPIIATLVKAMQEQQAIIEQLQQRIIQLENK